jgi:mRNA-degrading endonuclease toxin of MazEF toxin-antitoxin module
LKPGDVVVAMFPGVVETKVRPAVVLASETYLSEHPDVIIGLLTTKIPARLTTTDYVLLDWKAASLRAESCFRAFINTLPQSKVAVIGRLAPRDLEAVQLRCRAAFAL